MRCPAAAGDSVSKGSWRRLRPLLLHLLLLRLLPRRLRLAGGRRGAQPDGRGGGSGGPDSFLRPWPSLWPRRPGCSRVWLSNLCRARPDRQRGEVRSCEAPQTPGRLDHPHFSFPRIQGGPGVRLSGTPLHDPPGGCYDSSEVSSRANASTTLMPTVPWTANKRAANPLTPKLGSAPGIS